MRSTVLAIDPGTVSGFALIRNGRVEVSGEFRIDSDRGLHRARCMVEAESSGIMVVEAMGYLPSGKHFMTAWSMGRHVGMWETLARVNSMESHFLHPNLWQSAVLGAGRGMKRDARKALSIAVASKHVPYKPNDNEADAICMGLFVDTEIKHGRVPWGG
jgi:Holliday junction resolvasome RuvABC endonuclease subunit